MKLLLSPDEYMYLLRSPRVMNQLIFSADEAEMRRQAAQFLLSWALQDMPPSMREAEVIVDYPGSNVGPAMALMDPPVPQIQERREVAIAVLDRAWLTACVLRATGRQAGIKLIAIAWRELVTDSVQLQVSTDDGYLKHMAMVPMEVLAAGAKDDALRYVVHQSAEQVRRHLANMSRQVLGHPG